MKLIQVVKKDGSIHNLPEDFATKLIKSKEAKPYKNKMVANAPKNKDAGKNKGAGKKKK